MTDERDINDPWAKYKTRLNATYQIVDKGDIDEQKRLGYDHVTEGIEKVRIGDNFLMAKETRRVKAFKRDRHEKEEKMTRMIDESQAETQDEHLHSHTVID